MDARYARNVPAISEAECALLRTKKAAVIGCGGLGGHLIELLARVGVGCIRAVDGDVFEERIGSCCRKKLCWGSLRPLLPLNESERSTPV